MTKSLTVWVTTNCRKFLKMEITDHHTHLLKSVYAGQVAAVRKERGTTNWFQVRKGVQKGCISLPSLFNLYSGCVMQNAKLDEAQAGMKIAGRNINNLRYADDSNFMAESEELKSLFLKVKESEKVSLKLNIQ